MFSSVLVGFSCSFCCLLDKNVKNDYIRVDIIRVRIIPTERFFVISNSNVTCENRILIALRRVIRAVDIYSRKLNSDLGLTTPQLLCLDVVSKSDTLTLTDLAKNVNLGVSTVNGIVDRLEVKGYLLRKRSVKDRRKVYLEISDEGSEIVLRAPSLLQDKFSDSLLKLSEVEQMDITKSLERVVGLMEAEGVDASPNLFPSAKVPNNEL